MARGRKLVNSVLYMAKTNKTVTADTARRVFSHRIENNGNSYLNNSIMRTVRNLANQGLLERVERGTYKLTKAGKSVAKKRTF